MTRNKFDMQLEELEKLLTRMGELCELAIAKATGALKDGNIGQAKDIIVADEEIDQMEKEIERLCLKLLLQQQPVARDLRRISAALKMITDMERIGDQTADIAEIIITTRSLNDTTSIKDIGEMSAAVSKMVRDSVSAYVKKDLELAGKVIAADDEVDAMFDRIRSEMITLIAEDEGLHGGKAVDLIMITKYLERIGDHATNIAEWVEFSITGVHREAEEPML
ncbi:phosphate signaling complex protein PhoU [Hespellia stercorisuis]|uniref:Phosphate-specific transport system accessory protein PhoU n=1 Tax=Hespellia stercorisuis DSM 15480 TaxID=1121950 RepID=A0A1M6Q016_9FIRM|nr:phosphate signaling complex protein PhoU [Hespellia stercorisuis]SHK13538.1 phosphate uptake regulator, PhoU [Hespellia stercorisuis DSM 15480]